MARKVPHSRKPRRHDPDEFSRAAAAKARARAARPRTIALPEGFVRHDGGECPVDPASYVEVLVRTGEGIGSGQVHRAGDHHWLHAEHPGGLGAIVAWRAAERGAPAVFDVYDRFKLRGIA